jgi:hypothetical protein
MSEVLGVLMVSGQTTNVNTSKTTLREQMKLPKIQGISSAKAVYVTQERLGLPDLMDGVVDKIHLEVGEAQTSRI